MCCLQSYAGSRASQGHDRLLAELVTTMHLPGALSRCRSGSALTLKLLTSHFGAIRRGSEHFVCQRSWEVFRNWDYRFVDTRCRLYRSRSVSLGFTEEAELCGLASACNWLSARSCRPCIPSTVKQILVRGAQRAARVKGSRPVRIGNAAINQLQA